MQCEKKDVTTGSNRELGALGGGVFEKTLPLTAGPIEARRWARWSQLRLEGKLSSPLIVTHRQQSKWRLEKCAGSSES